MNQDNETWVGVCHEYDDKGDLIQEFKLVEITYGKNAEILTEQYYSKDRTKDYRLLYEYDEDSRLLEKKMYLGESHYHGRWVFHYTNHQIKQCEWYNKDGELEVKDVYKYSDSGKEAVRIRQDVGEWTHQWDDNNREIRVTGAPYSDVAQTDIQSTYDETGHLIRIEKSYLNKSTVTFQPKAQVNEQ
jgi:hypothetical protein